MAGRTVILVGDKRLQRKLSQLKSTEAKRIVRQAARPALRPVLAEARRLAPVGGRGRKEFRVAKDFMGVASGVQERRVRGALKRSLTIRALRRSRKRFGYQVTTRGGAFKGKTFYGGFIEWGWKTGKRGSSNRRQVEGRHFMKAAANNKRQEALAIYRNLIERALISHFRGA